MNFPILKLSIGRMFVRTYHYFFPFWSLENGHFTNYIFYLATLRFFDRILSFALFSKERDTFCSWLKERGRTWFFLKCDQNQNLWDLVTFKLTLFEMVNFDESCADSNNIGNCSFLVCLLESFHDPLSVLPGMIIFGICW